MRISLTRLHEIRLFLFLLVFIHILLVSKSYFFPYPEIFIDPYLVQKGFVPYREILDQHLPSLLMMPINFYTLGIKTPEAAKVFLAAIVTVNHLLIFLLVKRLSSKVVKLPVGNIFYFLLQPLFDGGVFWLDTILTPFLLASVLFLIRYLKNNNFCNLILSGFFLGLCIYIRQVYLLLFVLVVVGVYLKTKSLGKTFCFFLVCLVPTLITLSWISFNGLIKDFLFWTVEFNVNYYAAMAAKLPKPSEFFKIFLLLFPLLFLQLKKLRNLELATPFIFALFSVPLVFPRFELVHLQPLVPMVIVMSSLIYNSLNNKRTKLILTSYLFILLVFSLLVYKRSLGSFIYFFDPVTRETGERVNAITSKEDKIFIIGAQTIIYPIADRVPPGRVYVVPVPWTLIAVEDRILRGLLLDPPTIIVRDQTAEVDGKKIINYAKKINSFINENYSIIDIIGKNEILMLSGQRKI